MPVMLFSRRFLERNVLSEVYIQFPISSGLETASRALNLVMRKDLLYLSLFPGLYVYLVLTFCNFEFPFFDNVLRGKLVVLYLFPDHLFCCSIPECYEGQQNGVGKIHLRSN